MVHRFPANREPRRPTPTASVLSTRRAVLRAGVGMGLVAPVPLHPEPTAAATQTGWRFCTKCRGLFFQGSGSANPKKKGNSSGNTSLGACPVVGTHAPRTDLNGVLQFAGSPSNPNLLKNFLQCQKCRGLFSDDSGETGICPAGGAHVGGSPNYELRRGGTVPGMGAAWDDCDKCRGLFNYAGGNAGSCHAGGGHGRAVASTRYTLFALS